VGEDAAEADIGVVAMNLIAQPGHWRVSVDVRFLATVLAQIGNAITLARPLRH
jgi:hypothetical protein